MKAHIKATGDVVEVVSKVITSFTGEHKLKYVDQKTGISYFEEELFFPKDLEVAPDYWTRLEHQAAIAAMQGILSNHNLYGSIIQMTQVSRVAIDYAQELVEKMKEERK